MSKFNSTTVKETRPSTEREVKMPFGLNENCSLTSVVKGKTDSGVSYVDFNFGKTEDGTTFAQNKRIWFPDETKVTPRNEETMEAAVQRDINDRLDHIIYITEVVTGKELVIEANSFEEFVDRAMIAILQSPYKETKLRLLLQYDKTGQYAEFGMFPNYVERQVEGVTSKLKFSKWQLENRCTPTRNNSAGNDSGVANKPADVNDLF